MGIQIIIFLVSLSVLVFSAQKFTSSAEIIGKFFKLPQFVIGVLIVGVGTSLPELVTGIISVTNGESEILSGNVMGANISNLLLVTGIAVAINRKDIILNSSKIYIDLHFLLGSFFLFWIIAFDGAIHFSEAMIALLVYILYNFYLIKDSSLQTQDTPAEGNETAINLMPKFPSKNVFILIAGSIGIYFGADYTVSSITSIASQLHIPSSIIALTVLSLGTTLPEITVNISAIKQGKPGIAIGNILGSCMFNTLAIPGITSFFGKILVPDNLLSFSLPVMAASGLLFYLLNQDRRLSFWEGMLFILLYLAFLTQIAG